MSEGDDSSNCKQTDQFGNCIISKSATNRTNVRSNKYDKEINKGIDELLQHTGFKKEEGFEEDKRKSEIEKKLSNVSSSVALRVARPPKATIKDLTPEERMKSKMVMASKKAYESGFDAAQAYLDENRVPYDIDSNLSTKDSLVLLGNDDLKIAYRGTKLRDFNDVSADIAIGAGAEDYHPNFLNANEQMNAVISKYGKPSELLGYSLGGNKALTLGNKFKINTSTFNPLIGKNLLASGKGDHTHTIFRTTEDGISLGTQLVNKDNWNVKTILPHSDKVNPMEAHNLENFTEVSERRPGLSEDMIRGFAIQGQRVNQLEMIHDMKIAQGQGKTFTEFLHEFNSRGQRSIDTSADGQSLVGKRVHKDSIWVKYWEDAKNQDGSSSPAFNENELNYIESLGSGTSQQHIIKPSERAEFGNMNEIQRMGKILDEQDIHKKVMMEGDEHFKIHESTVNSLARAVHPVNLGTGLASGIAVHEVMEGLDSGHKLQPNLRTGIEGGLSGMATELGVVGLGEAGLSALSAPPVAVAAGAGSIGYLAGTKSGEAVGAGLTKAGADPELVKASSAITTGSVGGASTALAGIGGAALVGAEVGEIGGPVGVGLGAGIGSIIGGASYLISKLSN